MMSKQLINSYNLLENTPPDAGGNGTLIKRSHGVYESNRKEHIARKIREITDEFSRNYTKYRAETINKDSNGNESLFVWNLLKHAIISIQQNYHFIERITVFGDGPFQEIENYSKKAVFCVPEMSCDLSYDFSFARMPNDRGWKNSIESPEIIKGLSHAVCLGSVILITTLDLVLLLYLKERETNRSLYQVFAEIIGDEFVRVSNIIALSTANRMNNSNLLLLRKISHDLKHYSLSLHTNIHLFLGETRGHFSELPTQTSHTHIRHSHRFLQASAAKKYQTVVGAWMKCW